MTTHQRNFDKDDHNDEAAIFLLGICIGAILALGLAGAGGL